VALRVGRTGDARAVAHGNFNVVQAPPAFSAAIEDFPQHTGVTPLATAIGSTTIQIGVSGNIPDGGAAVSYRSSEPGIPAVIVVDKNAPPFKQVIAAIHEYERLSSGDPPPPLEPTEAEVRQQACREYNAHCAAITALMLHVAVYPDNNAVTCAFRRRWADDAEMEAHICNGGFVGTTPPSTPCSQGSVAVLTCCSAQKACIV